MGISLLQLVDENEVVAFDFTAPTPQDPLVCTDLDVGMGTPRVVQNNRSNANGVLDTTLYSADAVVTMSLDANVDNGDRMPAIRQLRALCMPNRRPYLHMATDDDGRVFRMQLRNDSYSGPLTWGGQIQVQWKAPEGVWESLDVNEFTINPDSDALGGFNLPFHLPLGMAPGTVPVLVSDGLLPTWLIVDIYGPCSGPELLFPDTGAVFKFQSGFSIASGDFVRIDFKERTVLGTGDPSLPRLSSVDWSATTSWTELPQLQPGETDVNFIAVTSPGAQAVFKWRDIQP